MEHVDSFKFLGVHISKDLTRTTGCSKLVKKAHQCLFFQRTLRKNHLSPDILVNFYRCIIKSILTNCITAWYRSCSASDWKAQQREVENCPANNWAPLPAKGDICREQYLKRAGKTIKDSSHPTHRLFTLLPSGRRYSSLQNSLYPSLLSSASKTTWHSRTEHTRNSQTHQLRTTSAYTDGNNTWTKNHLLHLHLICQILNLQPNAQCKYLLITVIAVLCYFKMNICAYIFLLKHSGFLQTAFHCFVLEKLQWQ